MPNEKAESATSVSRASQPTETNPLDFVPDKIPFHLIGRNRALEVLLSSEDIRADQAEAYGYINRALPDATLDTHVEALATRIAAFDKWAIANTKRLVNTSLPPDVELGAGWDACVASLGRPAAQNGIKALMALGFHKPGDAENRLGYYLSQIPH